jgi:AraC-like DNA-binding protein
LNSYGEAVISTDHSGNDVLVVEYDHARSGRDLCEQNLPPPARHDLLTIAGIVRGELTILVDYVTHRIPPNAILWIMPAHISQVIHCSPDFKAWFIMLSKNFLDEHAHPAHLNTPLIPYMQLKKIPFCRFEPDEFQVLYDTLYAIRTRIRMKNHLFRKETIINTLKGFMLDMGNFFFGKKENLFAPTLTRQEEVFETFLTLLARHCREERETSFYARKLCVTPPYLSRTIKEQSGRTAAQWIRDALMVEAKGLLRSRSITALEVSNALNFPDQSTFGKFFRKHAGITPLSFRNKVQESKFDPARFAGSGLRSDDNAFTP